MKHIQLGTLDVGRIGLGAMGMSAAYTGAGSDEAESIRTIHRALDLGVTLIDTAEIYGPYTNEELLGRAIKGHRDQAVVATKFGWISHTGGGPGVLDSTPANIRTAVEGSLQRLGTDRIDLYYQHRVDPNVPIEDVIGTLAELIADGKVRHIGLSEAWIDTIRRAHAVHPITALQSEYSLWTRDPEAEVLPLLDQLGIGFVPYSPLGHGFLTGTIRSIDDLADDDWRKTNPRFTGQNFQANLRHRRPGSIHSRRSRRHPRPSRPRLARRPRRQHRPHPRHQTRHTTRGKRRRRRHRTHRRPNRQAQQPHPRRRRPPQRSSDANAGTLTTNHPGLATPATPCITTRHVGSNATPPGHRLMPGG